MNELGMHSCGYLLYKKECSFPDAAALLKLQVGSVTKMTSMPRSAQGINYLNRSSRRTECLITKDEKGRWELKDEINGSPTPFDHRKPMPHRSVDSFIYLFVQSHQSFMNNTEQIECLKPHLQFKSLTFSWFYFSSTSIT